MPNQKIRIVLADDHALVLEGLRGLLAREPDMEVLAAFSDGAELLNALPRLRPDVIVLEVSDDGIGFTPPLLEGPGATEREEHIGLRGMRERVHLVGGQLRVISQPGQGTRVVVQVPCDT